MSGGGFCIYIYIHRDIDLDLLHCIVTGDIIIIMMGFNFHTRAPLLQKRVMYILQEPRISNHWHLIMLTLRVFVYICALFRQNMCFVTVPTLFNHRTDRARNQLAPPQNNSVCIRESQPCACGLFIIPYDVTTCFRRTLRYSCQNSSKGAVLNFKASNPLFTKICNLREIMHQCEFTEPLLRVESRRILTKFSW